MKQKTQNRVGAFFVLPFVLLALWVTFVDPSFLIEEKTATAHDSGNRMMRPDLRKVDTKPLVDLTGIGNGYTRDDALWLARNACLELCHAGLDTYDFVSQAVAVMNVTMNRVNSRHRGKSTIWGVIFDHAQFSWTLLPERRAKAYALQPDTDDREWQLAYSLALEFLKTPQSDWPYSKDADHFHHDYVNPKWAKTMKRTIVPGNPQLYVYE